MPAFGALVAEPLYVLADTAVVGHLGTPQLAGLAIASSVLLTAHAVCIFLAYGTTAAVSRLLGAGDDREAAHQAVQGLWLGALIGVALAMAGAPLAGPLVRALGATDTDGVAGYATTYLLVSLLGLPAMLGVLAGSGYLRGLQDTRTPLLVAVGTAVLNLVLEVVLIYGLDLGMGASAAATVVAQWIAAAIYVRRIGRAALAEGVGLRPDARSVRSLLRVGGALLVRTAALRSALVLATFVAASLGTVEVGAHQIGYELWNFLALALDAVASAGQALTGRLLGSGRVDDARAAARRMLELGALAGVAGGLAVALTRTLLASLFSNDPRVTALAAFVLLIVALLQPVNGVVFALDGILIGAGDAAFLAKAMVGAFVGFAAAIAVVLATDAGIGWLWASLGLFMVLRLLPLWRRFEAGTWAVAGAVRACR